MRVLDYRSPPIDKACGEGLMPDAVEALEALGVSLPVAGGGRPFVGIRWHQTKRGGASTAAIDGKFPGRPGIGLRRVLLHEALVRRADEVGVELCWGERATDCVLRDGSFVVSTSSGEELGGRGQVLVAADGLRSRLRTRSGLSKPPNRRSGRVGVRRHIEIEPWSDVVEVWWGDGIEAYVTPIADRSVGVAILFTPEKLRALRRAEPKGDGCAFGVLLRSFRELEERLSGAPVLSRDLGLGPLRQRVRAVVKRNLYLVGDASGYIDAITGEGMALAFEQAQVLATSLSQGRPALYARAHRRLGQRPRLITELVLLLSRHPGLRRRVFRVLASDESLFGRLLAVHVRSASLAKASATFGRLGWCLLARRPRWRLQQGRRQRDRVSRGL